MAPHFLSVSARRTDAAPFATVLRGMFVATLTAGGSLSAQTAAPPAATAAGIAAAQQEKATRTAAQAKLDSQIVLALRKSRGEPPFDKPTTLQPDLAIEPDGRVLVDLDAAVSKELLEQIEADGGKVLSHFAAARAIRALIPLVRLEGLAARADVKFISPAARAFTNQAP